MAKCNPLRGIGWKQILRFALFLFMSPVALFVAAGRLNWVMGWVCTGVSLGSAVVSRVIAARRNPELLAERGRALEAADVQGWDRLLLVLVGLVGPLATSIVAGLDQRFGWPPQVPLALQLVALTLMILGSLLATWAMVENKFFSAVVRIQKDRGQTVVTTGPYRFVRHPGYAGGLIAYLAMPFMLDALWMLIPALVIVTGIIVRTSLEDKTLQEGLDGYEDYAQRVRYRLLPGVW